MTEIGDEYPWIRTLSDADLDELRDGLCGSEGIVTANKIFDAVDAEQWRRQASPVTEWPRDLIKIVGVEEPVPIVAFCRKALPIHGGAGPTDPQHRPVRAMPGEVGYDSLLECSCGHRTSQTSVSNRAAAAVWLLGTSAWWPKEIRSVKISAKRARRLPAGTPVEHLETFILTCSGAQHVDDPAHAILAVTVEDSTTLMHCLCGYIYRPRDQRLFIAS